MRGEWPLQSQFLDGAGRFENRLALSFGIEAVWHRHAEKTLIEAEKVASSLIGVSSEGSGGVPTIADHTAGKRLFQRVQHPAKLCHIGLKRSCFPCARLRYVGGVWMV
jgi:hypothetical protein